MNFSLPEVDYNRNEREITQDRPRVPTQRRRSFGEDEDMHQRSNSAPSRKVEVNSAYTSDLNVCTEKWR